MQEEKAAAYYDDLRQKGGGAARFKQGLGFSSSSALPPNPKKDAFPSSMSNFVRLASPSRAAALAKESRLELVREKLNRPPEKTSKKKEPDSSLELPPKQRSRPSERDSSSSDSHRRRRRRRSRQSFDDDKSEGRRKREERPYRDSSSIALGSSRSSEDSSPNSRKRSSSRKGREKPASLTRRRRRPERSASDRSASGSSPDHRGWRSRSRSRHASTWKSQRRSSSRDSSAHSSDENRGRSTKTTAHNGSSSARSLHPERRRHDSRSHHPQDGSSRRKRSRSVSPRDSKRRSSNAPSEGRRETDDRARIDSTKESKKSKKPDYGAAKQNADFAKLIRNYDSMTEAEKVRAKMKLQLSETAMKDNANGTSEGWERYDFNKEAALDDENEEDTKINDFEDRIGARDDTSFLQNTGSTFLTSISQARRESQIKSAHDVAIFGVPTTPFNFQEDAEEDQDRSLPEDDEPSVYTVSEKLANHSSPPPPSSLINEKVFAMQQGSWRERALKLREQKLSKSGI